MRIISLVPSLTETLLLSGADVVGRSRYCIHPAPQVQAIPAVGGTKDADWSAVQRLNPDLVILDREENTREMAEQCPAPVLDLHITAVGEVAPQLQRLARATGLSRLDDLAERWTEVTARPTTPRTLTELPGVVQWWRRPTDQTGLEYLIWRNPWMAVGPETFIHSVLSHLGLGEFLSGHRQKYPEIDLQEHDPATTCLLFSSEPYPFARYRERLLESGHACALVDGEAYSWYGVRSLEFLEKQR